MGIFGKKIRLDHIYFGDSSADSERSKPGFFENVFVNDFGILDKIRKGKIIIEGRKGTGKSAVVEYVDTLKSSMKDGYRIFPRHLKFRASTMERLVHEIGQDATFIRPMWEWILYCNLLDLMESAEEGFRFSAEDRKKIQEFKRRNRGYVDIGGGEIIELIKNEGFAASVKPIASLINFDIREFTSTTEKRPAFYKVLPNLKNYIITLFSKLNRPDLEFFIFVDDLDEEYHNLPNQRKGILALLNACKEIFIELKKVGANVYPVCLIRSDMWKDLLNEPNAHKLKSDQTQQINWFNYQLHQSDPEKVLLRKMIELRLEYSLKKNFGTKLKTTYWDLIFKQDTFTNRDALKVMLNFTTYRPRDLIVLLNKVAELYPDSENINYDMIATALPKYFEELRTEWQSEVSTMFDPAFGQKLIATLRTIGSQQSYGGNNEITPRDFEEACNDLTDPGRVEHAKIVEVAFQYGMLAVIDRNGQSHWKSRENPLDPIQFRSDMPIMLHRAFTWRNATRY